MAEAKLRREVSILHAVMILVGYIVGSAIFILVGPLAGMSGPGLFIAFVVFRNWHRLREFRLVAIKSKE